LVDVDKTVYGGENLSFVIHVQLAYHADGNLEFVINELCHDYMWPAHHTKLLGQSGMKNFISKVSHST